MKAHSQLLLNDENFRELGFLKVEKREIFLKLVLPFKIIKQRVPRYQTDYYVLVKDVHGLSTRGSSTDIYLCRYKSLIGMDSFLYTSAIAWDYLPSCIKQIKVERVFRKEIKKWLLYH